MTASVLDMREQQQQLSYDNMINAIIKEKDTPSSIIVTHEQWVSLVKLHSSPGVYAVNPQYKGPETFAGIPLWIREKEIQ